MYIYIYKIWNIYIYIHILVYIYIYRYVCLPDFETANLEGLYEQKHVRKFGHDKVNSPDPQKRVFSQLLKAKSMGFNLEKQLESLYLNLTFSKFRASSISFSAP